MFLSNQIGIFFDYQYLWKELSDILHFLHRDINYRKVVSETNVFDWVWLGVPDHAQTCLDLIECP